MIPAYRCASCGSPNVVKDTQTGGIKYNYLKGAIGTAALGIGGAVAGITSDTQEVFKCPDCGLTLTFSLEEPWKSLIDIGNSSAEARKTLNHNGVPIDWSFLKGKYPNIEEGEADKEIIRNQKLEEKTIESIKSNSADIVSRIKTKLQANPDYVREAGKPSPNKSRLFEYAFRCFIEEFGGSYEAEDNGQYLLTVIESATGYSPQKELNFSENGQRVGYILFCATKDFGLQFRIKPVIFTRY